MKIQIVSWRDPQSPKAGGAEVCLREISRRLIGQFGHEVAWFAPRFEGSTPSEHLDGIHIERRGTAVHLEALRRFIGKRRQPADLYLEDYHGVTLGLRWFLKKPHVVLVHEVAGPIWLEMWKFPASYVGFGLEKVALRFLRHAHFIAVSPSTKADLVAHGIPPENVSAISEGSDIPARSAAIAREGRASRFVFVGRICKMKRVDLVLEAFALHVRRHPASRLALVGTMDEAFRPALERQLRELGIEGSVDLKGRVSQEAKAELLATSLALVSGSMREGFGLIVVEAASQGTPSLTFEVNGYRDLIESGVNGFMVPFPDVAAMARRMNDLLTMDAARYGALCGACLAAATQYSWDRTAADVSEILARIMAQEKQR